MEVTRFFRLRMLAVAAIAALAVVAALSLSGCGGDDGDEGGGQVTFLLPENVTPRWQGSDAPTFRDSLAELAPDAEVNVVNALNDASKQQQQAEAALTEGADVLVIAAVDQEAAAAIVRSADEQDVPVIAYDRLIKNAPLDYYVSFNSVTVGEAEAQWMADNTEAGDKLVVINGSPTDDNAGLVKEGIHSVLDPLVEAGDREIVAEQSIDGWDPTRAQNTMEQILTRQNNDIDGVVSANDGMAGGIIAALQGQGLAGEVMTTGQDASLEGVQNVIRGFQGVTVFKDFRLQAPAAAEIAAAILNDEEPGNITEQTNNGEVDVPTVMLDVVPIDETNVSELLDNGWIESQFGGIAAVCKGLPKTGVCA